MENKVGFLDSDLPIAYLCQTRSTKLERINV